MRYFILALLLAGCTLGGGKLATPTDSNPITGDAIAVTSLDAPPPVNAGVVAAAKPVNPAKPVEVAKPDVPLTEIKADPQADPSKAAAEPVAEPPARVLSPEEMACVKKGGQWTVAGKAGGMYCVSTLRDAGKSCRKESDCEGSCLARSNTCAPISPLFGCNEILQDNGAMVTLCID